MTSVLPGIAEMVNQFRQARNEWKWKGMEMGKSYKEVEQNVREKEGGRIERVERQMRGR